MIVTHEENAVGLVKTHDKCKPKGSVYFAAKSWRGNRLGRNEVNVKDKP